MFQQTDSRTGLDRRVIQITNIYLKGSEMSPKVRWPSQNKHTFCKGIKTNKIKEQIFQKFWYGFHDFEFDVKLIFMFLSDLYKRSLISIYPSSFNPIEKQTQKLLKKV